MKRRVLPFACFLLLTHLSLTQVIYVDSAATGANNGSSWPDAYTDLQAALNIASDGDEIWVAKGTYNPDVMNGNPTSTFLIDANIQLLGGFNGTETNADARDPEANEAILSGDLNGDDVEDDFASFKSDNVMTVVTIASNITNATLVDGFTIRNGQADGSGAIQDEGGGIYCEGSPTIQHCLFKQNYAKIIGGAARMRYVAGQNVIIENCKFEKNRANRGGAISFEQSQFYMYQCIFFNNSSVAGMYEANGAGTHITNSSGVVQNCSYDNNAADFFGGAILAWSDAQSSGTSVEIRGCQFNKNIAASDGGGLAYSPRGSNHQFAVVGCSFIENAAEYGGGVTLISRENANTVEINIDSCFFSKNTSSGSGNLEAILLGQETTLKISNTTFIELTNTPLEIWNGQGATGAVVIDSCTFTNNEVFETGGIEIESNAAAAVMGFKVSNCSFLNNYAASSCGGLSLLNGPNATSSFAIENCYFENNEADVESGALYLKLFNPNDSVRVINCKFLYNQCLDGKGAAIKSIGLGSAELLNCTVENCLLAGNTSTDGIIALESSLGIHFVNCTVADNSGAVFFLEDNGKITIQNTILHNIGNDVLKPGSEGNITSGGGNIFSEGNFIGLLAPSDLQNLDPHFVGGDDYHLVDGSPCIGVGNNDGVTAPFDLDGNPRIMHGIVDIGAYESPFPNTILANEVVAGELMVSPNPASDFLNLLLPETIVGLFDVQIFDTQGKLQHRRTLTAGQTLDVRGLVPGMYSLKAVVGERVFVGKFVKQ